MTTYLLPDRELGLRTGYVATDWSCPITYEDYTARMGDWDVQALMRNDTCIGAAYFRDGEVHVSVLPEWRKRWVTKSVLAKLFSHENAHTRIMPGHEYMYGIFERLGFYARDDGALVKGS